MVEKLMYKRIKAATVIVMVLLFCLIGRFAYLFFVQGKTYGQMASTTRLKRVDLSAKRANIVDRNGIPLTKTEEVVTELKLPSINGSKKLQYISEKTSRQPLCAKHVVGYLDITSTKGITGLQRVYNEELSSNSAPRLEYSQSANNAYVLDAPKIRQKVERLQDVKTTLDINIQRICETAFQNSGHKKGAVVVEDIKTGEILALASFPEYNVDTLNEDLKNPNRPFINRALSEYNVGSIFKIVDTLAFISNASIEDIDYECKGAIDVNGHKIHCSGHVNHGKMNLKSAFAKSCNTYFVNLAVTNNLNLYDYVQSIEFLSQSQFSKLGIKEELGNIPTNEQIFNDVDIANTALGQGSMKATPLQVCSLISTIANKGIYNEAQIISDQTNRLTKNKKVLNENLCEKLSEYMLGVTTNGTGTNLTTKNLVVAGKTGTAEVENNTSHAWFAGYGPFESPKYSITVFVENGGYGGSVAGKIFGDICCKLQEAGLM